MNKNQFKIINAGDMSGIVYSQIVDLGNISLGSIQAVYSGAPTGSLQLQISDDIVPDGGDPDTDVVNWDNYGSATAVVAAGHFTFNISNMGYKWVRLVYTPSAGTGVIDATAVGQNV